MSEIEKLNMIAEWQEQYKQLIEDLNNSKKRTAELEKEVDEVKLKSGYATYLEDKIKIEDLEKENAELNDFIMQSKKDGISPINALIIKNLDMQLTKAKEIIKNLRALYLSPVVTKDDVKRQDEILAKAEQFLNREVEK